MAKTLKLGLRENWWQFTILVIINAFVGGMVGMERTILPDLATSSFGIDGKSAILSFIVSFGIAKAITNYFTGKLANRLGRKKLLVLGWIIALPIPFLIIHAPSWSWVVFANILLGINQGLTWSSTVIMKIDLVGPKNRGLAMGINESAGYLAVGGVAFLSGWIGSAYGITPYPFYIGIVLSIIGLLSSWLMVQDTTGHMQSERSSADRQHPNKSFWEISLTDKNLGSITQAGMVNNLNDGMIWGLLPLLLMSLGFALEDIALVVAIYPSVWGVSQLITGKLADLYQKKKLLFWGMLLQGVAIILVSQSVGYWQFAILGIFLGLGTAIVYPTFLAAISDYTSPAERAHSIGIFRLWRDAGYAIGALISGIIADVLGLQQAIWIIGLVTIFSSLVLKFRMTNQ